MTCATACVNIIQNNLFAMATVRLSRIGAQSTDFVLLFMNDGGMNSLLKSKFEVSGDATVATAPVGRLSEMMMASPTKYAKADFG